MSSEGRLWNMLAVVAVGCALVSTALAVRRQVFPPPPLDVQPKIREIEEPEQFNSGGHLIGDAAAPVVIVEFSDFECPYCGVAARGILRQIREEFPRQVAIRYRHAPGPAHRFAIPAARASACAASQGRFTEYHDELFAKQDSLGLVPFERMADESGVGDISAFKRCYQSDAPVPGLEADRTAARSLALAGTPSFIINGKLLTGLPDEKFFREEVLAALRVATK